MGRTKTRKDPLAPTAVRSPERITELNRDDPIGDVAGPGRWFIVEYQATTLFSLKTSQATSSVGVTLVIPTPYAIKMAFVDAAFRFGTSDDGCEKFLASLANIDVRISPAPVGVVTNTFIKVRQERRDADPLRPYGPNIAYRELVYLNGPWRWAFDLSCCDQLLAEHVIRLAPYIGYVGKRGSFVQFVKAYRQVDLGAGFTRPINNHSDWTVPKRSHVRQLDDFGPEANLQVLSSFTSRKPKQEKHRRFVPTIIPVGIVNTGPGFSEYRAE